MQVTFWGTRGSIAKAGPSTVRYGGNTSCVSIRSDGRDATRPRLRYRCPWPRAAPDRDGRRRPVDGHILISHTHWDHIQGLPFFAPCSCRATPGTSTARAVWESSLGEILAGQMEYRYFPVEIGQLSAHVEHHDLVEGDFEIDDIVISTRYLNHPALTLGYRIEVDGAVVVYSSDHEPYDQELAVGGDLGRNRHDDAHARFVAGADLLIHDAQYLGAEYPDHVGWGHSTVEYVVDLARRAGVHRVALYHHDPSRTDEQIDELLELARAHARAAGYDGEILAATEGRTVAVRGDRPRPMRPGTPVDSAVTSALGSYSKLAVVSRGPRRSPRGWPTQHAPSTSRSSPPLTCARRSPP